MSGHFEVNPRWFLFPPILIWCGQIARIKGVRVYKVTVPELSAALKLKRQVHI